MGRDRGGTAVLAAFVCAFFGSLNRFKDFEASLHGVKETVREANWSIVVGCDFAVIPSKS